MGIKVLASLTRTYSKSKASSST